MKNKNRSESFFCRVRDAFSVFARKSSNLLGSAWSFVAAIVVIVLWAATGPAFHYSDTWQLIINTGTSIVTMLMVFLIQNTQNRDAKAMHLKLAELIRSHEPARDHLVDLEKLSDDELTRLEKEFGRLRLRARRAEGPEAKTDGTVKGPFTNPTALNHDSNGNKAPRNHAR